MSALVWGRQIFCAYTWVPVAIQLKCFSHTVDPSHALNPDVVLFCRSDACDCHTFLQLLLENIGFCDLYERGMRSVLFIFDVWIVGLDGCRCHSQLYTIRPFLSVRSLQGIIVNTSNMMSGRVARVR